DQAAQDVPSLLVRPEEISGRAGRGESVDLHRLERIPGADQRRRGGRAAGDGDDHEAGEGLAVPDERAQERGEAPGAAPRPRPGPLHRQDGRHRWAYAGRARGSRYRFSRSTTRLTTTNESAMKSAAPCTTCTSRAMTELTSWRPSPGQPKTSSVNTAPPSRSQSYSPAIVTVGGQATRNAWALMTTRSASPLARATMMYSCPRISSTDARVIRAMMAPGAAAVVTAGSTRWVSRSPRPPAPRVEYIPRLGSQRRSMAKTMMRTRPSQKGGMLPTTSEAPMVARSIAVLSRAAARTPTAMPAVAARTKLAPARINVLPNFGRSSSTTGWCTMGDVGGHEAGPSSRARRRSQYVAASSANRVSKKSSTARPRIASASVRIGSGLRLRSSLTACSLRAAQTS